jgi:hypothetical protein
MSELPANATARLLSAAASDNAANVTGQSARLRKITGYNAASAGRYLKLYDKATAPASTDTPRKTIYLPATTPFAIDFDDYFTNGLGYRITTGSADNDTGALTSGDILGLNIDYR